MSCEMRNYLAAHVLGALEPDEAAKVESHLCRCVTCRDEVAQLSQVPVLLSLVQVEDIEGPVHEPDEPPPTALLERLLAATRAEDDRGPDREERPAQDPARRRPRGALALAAGAAVAATIAGFATFDGRPGPPMTSVTAVDPATHVRATVVLVGRSWGTQLGLTLSRAYAGKTCWLVAHADDGRAETAATWVASQDGAADVPGATAIAPDRLTELDVIAANGHRIVRIALPHRAPDS